MKPSKELVHEWDKQADKFAWDTAADPSWVDTRNMKFAELAAAWGAEQSLDGEQLIGFMSPKQLERICDPKDESGVYIPLRKTAAGNFTLALYAAMKKQGETP